MRPSLVLPAGPNGAGKSTLSRTRVAPSFAGPFVDAGTLQHDELRDPSMAASSGTARIAEARRIEMLETCQSYATGTVFSLPSRLAILDAARTCGYLVVVLRVGVDGPDLCVARARARADMMFPKSKVCTRHKRSQPLIREAVMRKASPTLLGWILAAYAANLTV